MTAQIEKFAPNGTPRPNVIFQTIEVHVTPDVLMWFDRNQSRVVADYLARKYQEGNGVVKVGRTVTRTSSSDPRIYGDFVWSLRGLHYPQVARYNEDEQCWYLLQSF
jgi:hypothetical protein